jgi:lipoyl-dependent peroxiredoxin
MRRRLHEGPDDEKETPMASESRATTIWEGRLEDGRGETTTASGTLSGVEVTWQHRVERTDDSTSPEELLAAAHASCYCMALSHELGGAGHAPERLETAAVVSFVAGEGVKSSHLTVSGRVEGMDQAGFEAAAAAAGEGCPISGALKGNVEVTVDATLEG